MVIIKKLFLFLLFIFMTNAIHGMLVDFAWDNGGPSSYGTCCKFHQQKLSKEQRSFISNARATRAVQKKSMIAEEDFYEQLNFEKVWWPDLSDVEESRRNTLMSALEIKYGISGDIFQEPYSVQQAYTHMLIDFIKQHVAGENLLRIAIFNHKIVDLMVDKTLLQPLVNYAHTQLNDSKFSYELSYAQKDILWKYKQFIGTKKPSGHQRETRTTIQTTFHSLLCFWFFKTFKKKSVTFAQQDSSNFEDGAGSCCRCW